ncbi:MAG TPA: VCBS repeat-containing protein, partial [Verrucomicrobiae bacterium]|nr:VCBS repeat-containing protein [Verrucomicrobiae bacterium]
LDSVIPATRGAVFADINGDGFLDLLISVTGRGVLTFMNDGHGHFTDTTAAAGTGSKLGSTTMALADIDGNGTLDLYIANYRTDDIRDHGRVSVSIVQGRPVMRGAETNRFVFIDGQLAECGQPDQLLLNDGSGHFKPISWTDGTFLDDSGHALKEAPLDWGLTATFRDVNGDLAPDLYVCNDYWTPDRFWINDGHGHFRAAPKLSLRKTSASSMSVDFADIDRDGYVDFFVVDMLSRYPQLRKRQGFAQKPMASSIGAIDDRPQVMRNTLFLNRRDGTFAEVAFYGGVAASDWSWAPVFMDVDLDGYEDLVVGAGHFRDVQDYDAEQQVQARQHPWDNYKSDAELQKAFAAELMQHYRLYPWLRMPIASFRNQHDCSFTETTAAWGLDHLGVHQGLVVADLDGDGDLDLIVNDLNSSALIFRNETSAARVAVRLHGHAANTQGIGAKVSLFNGAVPRQTTEIVCGGRYLSGSDTEAVFAAGASKDMRLEVQWRNGNRSVVDGVKPNCLYEIDETGASADTTKPASPPVPLFEDATAALGHKHHQAFFNDYERQPLLPFKLSQMGPGIAWADLDGDGHDDLVIGSGRGGVAAVLRSDGHGRFTNTGGPGFTATNNDITGILVSPGAGPSGLALLGLSGYEQQTDNAVVSARLDSDASASPALLPSTLNTSGALALADMNGDGHLVLFVAGSVLPGQYPLGGASKLFRCDQNGWRLDQGNTKVLEHAGLVNGAVWSDLDGDGLPELILACEWGPIRVFKTRDGMLHEITKELGLESFTGLWRGVNTGDLNNDGRMDIVASNWGLNSRYRASESQPLVLFYGPIFQPGQTEIIETEYVNGALCPSRQFRALAESMPFLHERFQTHKAFSEATVEQLLGERMSLAARAQARTLVSTEFLNEGNGFRAVPLAREAQFAPGFAVNIADLDGDGNEDVFISQNFFDLQPEASRIDAGTGLCLKGNGKGDLVPMPVAVSGVRVYGEQRGAALADYDEDGRVDLAVTQNGAATKLFHNVGAAPGLRVKLKGGAGNPAAIGAAMRLVFKDHKGPLREIHAGSGYWSQDSFTQVLAIPSPPESLWVRWPGGRTTTTLVPANAREVTVDETGKVTAHR